MQTLNKDRSLTNRIKKDVLNAIQSKQYGEGSKIPTEKQLCQQYGVSRITVQNAILSLVNDGVLYRVKGKGTYVKKKVINWHFMTKDTSFNEQILNLGMVPSTVVLHFEVVSANEQIAENLNIAENESVIHLLRLRYANREPVAIVDSYMPQQLCGHIMDYDFAAHSLHGALNTQPQSTIVRVVRYVEAISAGNTEKLLLNVPKGSPIQFFTNYALNDRNQVVDYCVSYYRGDKSRFAVEIIPAEHK